MNPSDKLAFEQAKPFLRGALAFLLFMRAPDLDHLEDFFNVADMFLDRLEKDLGDAR